MTDGDRRASTPHHTCPFALPFLWADPPADGRQRVVLGDDPGGLVEPSIRDRGDEIRDADSDGTAVDADGPGALEAAARLEYCELLGVAEIDLPEVRRSLTSLPFRHGGARHLHPFALGRLAHGEPISSRRRRSNSQ